jgi:hypothetical protein
MYRAMPGTHTAYNTPTVPPKRNATASATVAYMLEPLAAIQANNTNNHLCNCLKGYSS